MDSDALCKLQQQTECIHRTLSAIQHNLNFVWLFLNILTYKNITVLTVLTHTLKVSLSSAKQTPIFPAKNFPGIEFRSRVKLFSFITQRCTRSWCRGGRRSCRSAERLGQTRQQQEKKISGESSRARGRIYNGQRVWHRPLILNRFLEISATTSCISIFISVSPSLRCRRSRCLISWVMYLINLLPRPEDAVTARVQRRNFFPSFARNRARHVPRLNLYRETALRLVKMKCL